ncbi:ABC transporter permease [Pseudalkalibacillus salsuginis]|uniref:ABC transporter permease n=1 Tax=Pseudalkalibacillus salsuginis TaxID=2910972 RepID=UPI001F3C31E7|nr:ABC transporter permease [Pseudalkalibacillus salsuginis]MCF6411394.1 ABC transporter permease [Pseudalkalibacillus salsuginis]
MGDRLMEKQSILSVIAKHREAGLIGFIIILSIVFQLLNPKFLTIGNLANLITNTTILIILAVGMMLVLITRGIDLSIGSTLALSGMTSSLFVSAYPGLNPLLAILLGIMVGIICGIILGYLVSIIGILPIIASLGLMNVYRGLTFWSSGGGWVSAHQMPASFKGIATSSFLGVNTLILIAIAIFLFFYFFVNYTITGRQIYAVGSNPESAEITGINSKKILLLVYTIMGGLSGLAGVLWVSKFASAQGDTASGYELTVIAACILGGVSIAGGVGRITGVLLGAILLGILDNALPLIDVSPFWQMGIEGGIILFAVLFNVIVNRAVQQNELARRVV